MICTSSDSVNLLVYMYPIHFRNFKGLYLVSVYSKAGFATQGGVKGRKILKVKEKDNS